MHAEGQLCGNSSSSSTNLCAQQLLIPLVSHPSNTSRLLFPANLQAASAPAKVQPAIPKALKAKRCGIRMVSRSSAIQHGLVVFNRVLMHPVVWLCCQHTRAVAERRSAGVSRSLSHACHAVS
jgi:hypothetical protein